MNYSFGDMAEFFVKKGVPQDVVRNMADPFASMVVFKRPVMDSFKFDDFLHKKYGNYESKGKSMQDMCIEFFGEDLKKAEYYLGFSQTV